ITLHGTTGETLLVGNPLITVGDENSRPSDQPGALDYREEEQAGIAAPKEAAEEGSGNVLIGYGTTGGTASGRTRARKRPATEPTATPENRETHMTAPKVISPLVRQLAKRHGIDISQLAGSGQGGVVLRADVQAAIEQTP